MATETVATSCAALQLARFRIIFNDNKSCSESLGETGDDLWRKASQRLIVFPVKNLPQTTLDTLATEFHRRAVKKYPDVMGLRVVSFTLLNSGEGANILPHLLSSTTATTQQQQQEDRADGESMAQSTSTTRPDQQQTTTAQQNQQQVVVLDLSVNGEDTLDCYFAPSQRASDFITLEAQLKEHAAVQTSSNDALDDTAAKQNVAGEDGEEGEATPPPRGPPTGNPRSVPCEQQQQPQQQPAFLSPRQLQQDYQQSSSTVDEKETPDASAQQPESAREQQENDETTPSPSPNKMTENDGATADNCSPVSYCTSDDDDDDDVTKTLQILILQEDEDRETLLLDEHVKRQAILHAVEQSLLEYIQRNAQCPKQQKPPPAERDDASKTEATEPKRSRGILEPSPPSTTHNDNSSDACNKQRGDEGEGKVSTDGVEPVPPPSSMPREEKQQNEEEEDESIAAEAHAQPSSRSRGRYVRPMHAAAAAATAEAAACDFMIHSTPPRDRQTLAVATTSSSDSHHQHNHHHVDAEDEDLSPSAADAGSSDDTHAREALYQSWSSVRFNTLTAERKARNAIAGSLRQHVKQTREAQELRTQERDDWRRSAGLVAAEKDPVAEAHRRELAELLRAEEDAGGEDEKEQEEEHEESKEQQEQEQEEEGIENKQPEEETQPEEENKSNNNEAAAPATARTTVLPAATATVLVADDDLAFGALSLMENNARHSVKDDESTLFRDILEEHFVDVKRQQLRQEKQLIDAERQLKSNEENGRRAVAEQAERKFHMFVRQCDAGIRRLQGDS